jgi:putative holliday junction resolvase
MPEGRARIVLGFDFGQKRIGIASGDTLSGTAAPCATVRCGDGAADWGAIERLLQQFKPDLLVVGSPRHADGTASSLASAADRFAAELQRRSRLPVERCDEYASSLEAAAALRELRASRQRRRRVRRGDLDGAAAAIILQRWLGAHVPGAHADATRPARDAPEGR